VIGCGCAVCLSTDKKNQRLRSSVLITTQGLTLLIDAAPELRLQCLRVEVAHVDAVLLTHAHYDHIGGLDDLRIFSERSGRAIPIFGNAETLQQVQQRYDYVFRPTQRGGGKPRFSLRSVAGAFQFKRLKVSPLPLWHGRLGILGYRIGALAYMTDASRLPAATYPLLRELDTLVINALRHEPHATHFNLTQALAEAAKIRARRTFLTHICHRLEHRATQKLLPKGLALAYDGLRVKVKS
jgi:phosphoribosyl 1,2-cyclic phosphate phosphodiesterase